MRPYARMDPKGKVIMRKSSLAAVVTSYKRFNDMQEARLRGQQPLSSQSQQALEVAEINEQLAQWRSLAAKRMGKVGP